MGTEQDIFNRAFGVGHYPARFFDFFNWGAFAEPLIWGVIYGTWPIVIASTVAQAIPYAILFFLPMYAPAHIADSFAVILGIAALSQLLTGIVRVWAGMNANRFLWLRESLVVEKVRNGKPRWSLGHYLSRQRAWARIAMAAFIISSLIMSYLNYVSFMDNGVLIASFVAGQTIVWLIAIVLAALWIAMQGTVVMDPRHLFSFRAANGASSVEGVEDLMASYNAQLIDSPQRRTKTLQLFDAILKRDDADQDGLEPNQAPVVMAAEGGPEGPKHFQVETFDMHDGQRIPSVGFGTYKTVAGSEAESAVLWALNAGYRHIDTASMYGNEESIGVAIFKSGVNRDEIFITSKVWNDQQGYLKTITAFEETLLNLGTDYIDLYLIHWPIEKKLESTWRALEHLYLAGKIRAIGVCNFEIHHLEQLQKHANILPYINQLEIHPRFARRELVEYCQNLGIVVEAWAPLMRGGVFDIPELKTIGQSHNKSAGQVALRWALDRGIVVLPKSVSHDRIMENWAVFDFVLTDAERQVIDALDKNQRIGPNPDTFSWEWPKSARN